MIVIRRFSDNDTAAVKKIYLDPNQVMFACTAEAFLAKQTSNMHLHVICNHQDVIGFFILDPLFHHDVDVGCIPALGLRKWVIGKQYQGKGLGTCAIHALLPYVQCHYRDVDAVYLTVNRRNERARQCYLKGGFTFTGQAYLQGPNGPQDVMRAVIENNAFKYI